MSWSTKTNNDTLLALKRARDHFISNAPASFVQLNSDTRGAKFRQRQVIENNWTACIEQCLPDDIKPRQIAYKGQKVKRGDSNPAADWWLWPIDLLYKLSRLSGLTQGKLPFAQELMTLEVSRRHRDLQDKSRERAGILDKDVDRIIEALVQRLDDKADDDDGSDDDDDEDDDSDLEDTQRAQNPYIKPESSHGPGESMSVREPDLEEPAKLKRELEETSSVSNILSESVTATSTPRKRAKTTISSSSNSTFGANDLKNRAFAEAAELRAKAMRLEEQAARLKAQAYDVEARGYRNQG